MIGILMESIEGVTLRSFVDSLFRSNQSLNEDGLSLLLLQLALQVKCLHDAGIVHRDLSLANVMLDEANGKQARIIDFGLATAANNPLPPTKEGRWDFVAPESRSVQRYGTRWKRSSGDLTKLDIYSLGMILLKAGNRAVFGQERLEEEPFEPLLSYNMNNLIPGSDYLSRLCYLMLSEDPDSRPSIDTVIELIQMAKPELSPVSSEFGRLWKLTKEYAERVWRSVISGKKLKQHRHRSPTRPLQLSAY
jgi:serine/threonine protein kinase